MGLRLDLHLYVGTFESSDESSDESSSKRLNPAFGVGNPGYSSRCRAHCFGTLSLKTFGKKLYVGTFESVNVGLGLGLGLKERFGVEIGAAMGDWNWD